MTQDTTGFSALQDLGSGRVPAPQPEFRIVGDVWNFSYTFVERDGSPTALNGLTPGADVVVAPGVVPTPLSVVGISGNTVKYTLRDSTGFSDWSPLSHSVVRIRFFVVDSQGGRTTYGIRQIVPFRSEFDDLSVLPEGDSVLTSAGPVGAKGDPGIASSQQAIDDAIAGAIRDQLPTLKGDVGDSAYQVAVDLGFQGTRAQWLASLVGAPGKDSKVPGPPGLDSTVPGPAGKDSTIPGPPGLDSTVPGPPGLTAYQVALVQGFVGSPSDFLRSLLSVTLSQLATMLPAVLEALPASPPQDGGPWVDENGLVRLSQGSQQDYVGVLVRDLSVPGSSWLI